MGGPRGREGRLEEDLVRDATVLVLVAATLSNVLKEKLVSSYPDSGIAIGLTDFTTGLLAITVVLKLNGPAAVMSLEPFSLGDTASSGAGLKLKDDFVGLKRSLLPMSITPFGNEALSGDRASRSMGIPELISEAC